MIELPWFWIGAGLLAAGVVLAISLRLDPDVPPRRRRRRRTEHGGLATTHDRGDHEEVGRDA